MANFLQKVLSFWVPLPKKGCHTISLLELFCAVDDFWKEFEPVLIQQQLTNGERHRQRAGQLCESEMMTIVIHFHQARYRDFKTYYTQYVQVYLRSEFPQLISI